jgi:hypothetical protein
MQLSGEIGSKETFVSIREELQKLRKLRKDTIKDPNNKGKSLIVTKID